jgi:hypothetical protein
MALSNAQFEDLVGIVQAQDSGYEDTLVEKWPCVSFDQRKQLEILAQISPASSTPNRDSVEVVGCGGVTTSVEPTNTVAILGTANPLPVCIVQDANDRATQTTLADVLTSVQSIDAGVDETTASITKAASLQGSKLEILAAHNLSVAKVLPTDCSHLLCMVVGGNANLTQGANSFPLFRENQPVSIPCPNSTSPVTSITGAAGVFLYIIKVTL